MKKRISLLILCACLLLALVGVSAFAADEADTSATISTAEELAAALDAEGEYILAADLSLNASTDLTVGATNFVLDLDGHTITFQGQNTFVVNAGSSVTFKNGDVLVAHSYKTEGLLKTFGKYKPVQNTDGSYTIGAEVAIDSSVFAEQDRLQTLAAPAFLTNGGSVTLDGIYLERNVSVSNGGQLIEALDGGSLSLLNSELYVSAPSEAWATIDTSVIKLTRAESVTKLVIENSFVHEVMQNCVYNGTYYSKEAPTKINASTGAVTKVGYHLDTDDSANLCTIAGTTANTGVEITIDQSDFIWTHHGFYDAITDSSVSFNDTLTMKNSRVKVNQASNYQSVGFQFYSADLVFENCYMDMSDDIFYIGRSGSRKTTTSLTLRGCYVKGSHCIRYATDKNAIYIENSYVQGALQRWYNYTSETNTGSPSVTISGKLYTLASVNEDAPTTSYKESKNSTFWFNVNKTNDTDAIVTVTEETIPAWTHTIAHPDGSSYSNSINTNTIVASEGDTVILWANTKLTANGNINLVTFGKEITLNLTGNANPTVVDGTPGKVSFIMADGVKLYYLNNTYYTVATATSLLSANWTLVLQEDQHVPAPNVALPKLSFAIDLNGYTIYISSDTEDGTKNGNGLFIINDANQHMHLYSSRPGARILGGHTHEVNKEGATVEATPNYATRLFNQSAGNLSIGYDINGNIAGERIDLVAGQMMVLTKGNFKANNVAWYIVSEDNNCGFLLQNSDNDKSFHVSNSDFYIKKYSVVFFYKSYTAEKSEIVLENCNLYSTATSKFLFAPYGGATIPTQTAHLINTNVYNMKVHYNTSTHVYVEGECHLPSMVNDQIELAPGYGAVYQGNRSVTLSGTSYPEKSRLNMPEMTDLNKAYSYNTVVSRYSDYKASIYTNVTLDTALDLHLYIPKADGIASVLVDGADCFDADAIDTLNGKDYYVVTIARAPKEMHKTALVEIIFKDGETLTKYYTLEHSLLNYASNLLDIDEEKYSDTAKNYIVDSKNVMRYVLNYAKETIERYGELDAETLQAVQGRIQTLLGDFALTEDDLVLENVKTDIPTGTGTAAAFDLDSKVGFVLGVADTFTGHVSVTMGDRVVTGDFVATNDGTSAPVMAGYVILDGIFAYELYTEEITITITGTNGDTAVETTFTYNLATYANSGVSEDLGTALYAYAKVADTYGRTYNVSTID